MNDDVAPAHAAADQVGVADRADVRRERRVKQVKPRDFVLARPQRADEGLA
jgi:hypothetical protein